MSGFRYLARQDGFTNGRIAQFEFYVSADGISWGTPVASGTLANVATEQEVLFAPKTGQYVWLRALTEVSGLPYSAVAELNVLASGNRPPESSISSPVGDVTIMPGQTVPFSGGGTDPEGDLPLTYLWTFGVGGPPSSTTASPGDIAFPTAGTYDVTFAATDALGNADPTPARRTVFVQSGASGPISQAGWTLHFVDSQAMGYEATKAFDGNAATFWHTQFAGASPPPPHDIGINLGEAYNVSGFRYLPRQDGSPNGRIAQYEFFVSVDGVSWGAPVATGTLANVATEQQLVFTPKLGQYVRLRALSEVAGRPYSAAAEIRVLASGNRPPESTISLPSGDVTIAPGESVTFGGTGSDPEGDVPLTYLWTFGAGGPPSSTSANPGSVTFPTAGVYHVAFSVTDALGNADPTPAGRTILVEAPSSLPVIPRTSWSLLSVDSQATGYEAVKTFDGSPGTFWHTQYVGSAPPPPHDIRIDMGALYDVGGFRYLPRQDGSTNGRIGQFEFYVSADGVSWGPPVAAGALANAPAQQEVIFTSKLSRYVRLRALTEVNGLPYSAVAELNVLGNASTNLPPESTIGSPASDITIAPGGKITFAGSGTDPESNLPLSYLWTFGAGGPPSSTSANPGDVVFPNSGEFIVTFRVTDSLGNPDPTPATRTVTVQSGPSAASLIPQAGWSLRFVDSQDLSGGGTYLAVNAFDGDPGTFWHSQWLNSAPSPPHEIQIDLGATYNVSGFRYLPRQASQYGRVGEYEFYVSADGSSWGTAVAVGAFPDTNSSAPRDVTFPQKAGRYVRFRALSDMNAENGSAIAELNVFQAGAGSNQAPIAAITSLSGSIVIRAGSAVPLSGSGSDPDGDIPLAYRWSVSPGSGIPDVTDTNAGFVHFERAGTFVVSFSVADARGRTSVVTRSVTVSAGTPLSRTGWSLRFVDDEAAGFPAAAAFDGNVTSFWHTEWSPPAPLPHEIQIDLGTVREITGFRYLPRQDGVSNGTIGQYAFFVSSDGADWGAPAASGTFAPGPSRKEIAFTARNGRYVRLQALSESGGRQYTSVAELEVLGRQCLTPSIRLVRPRTGHLQATTSLQVIADACVDEAAGQGVRFVVDGVAVDDYASPFVVTASPLGASEHVVEAFVIDASGTPVAGIATFDVATPVGVGDYYVAMGDGMTYGLGDDIPTDDNSQDRRTLMGGGYTSILGDALTLARTRPVFVANEGVMAAASADGLNVVASLLARHPDAQAFIIMYGHNDVQRAVPSGLGLTPASPGYAGTFKDRIQRIITAVRTAGKAAILVKAPPTLPLNGAGDTAIQQYNAVMDELAADPANGVSIPPVDLYSYFRTRTTTHYWDDVLMNGLGYQSMAQVFLEAVTP